MPDLDDRIRNLVATAVADAPPAPDIEALPVPAITPQRPNWLKRGGVALAALLAGLGGVAVLQPADEGDVDTTPDNTPTTVAAPVAAPSVIVTAGPNGVREIVDSETRVVTTDPMKFAVALDDGSVVAQRHMGDGRNVAGGGWSNADTIPTLFSPDGTTRPILETETLSGGLVLHDFAVVDDRRLLLYSLTDQTGGFTESVAVLDLDSGQRIAVGRVGHDGAGVSRLSLGGSGLIIGTDGGGNDGGLVALAVPDSPAATKPLPKESDFGFGGRSIGCKCPTGFAIDSDGTTVYWLAPTGTPGNTGALVALVAAPLTDPSRAAVVGQTRFDDELLYGLEIDPGQRGVIVNTGNRYGYTKPPVLVPAEGPATTLEGRVATTGPNG